MKLMQKSGSALRAQWRHAYMLNVGVQTQEPVGCVAAVTHCHVCGAATAMPFVMI